MATDHADALAGDWVKPAIPLVDEPVTINVTCWASRNGIAVVDLNEVNVYRRDSPISIDVPVARTNSRRESDDCRRF